MIYVVFAVDKVYCIDWDVVLGVIGGCVAYRFLKGN